MVLLNSLSPHTALVISDASIKNDIATSISHVHIANRPIVMIQDFKGLSQETTLVLSDTRELDRVPSTE